MENTKISIDIEFKDRYGLTNKSSSSYLEYYLLKSLKSNIPRLMSNIFKKINQKKAKLIVEYYLINPKTYSIIFKMVFKNGLTGRLNLLMGDNPDENNFSHATGVMINSKEDMMICSKWFENANEQSLNLFILSSKTPSDIKPNKIFKNTQFETVENSVSDFLYALKKQNAFKLSKDPEAEYECMQIGYLVEDDPKWSLIFLKNKEQIQKTKNKVNKAHSFFFGNKNLNKRDFITAFVQSNVLSEHCLDFDIDKSSLKEIFNYSSILKY